MQAELGVAVHSGSHLGKEASELTLIRGDPAQILDFLNLAKRVNGKVRQNLGWSFVYNAVSIPVAMTGLLFTTPGWMFLLCWYLSRKANYPEDRAG